jgi:hypothetical protein
MISDCHRLKEILRINLREYFDTAFSQSSCPLCRTQNLNLNACDLKFSFSIFFLPKEILKLLKDSVSLVALNLEGICLAKTLALVTLFLWNFDLSELFHNDVALTSFFIWSIRQGSQLDSVGMLEHYTLWEF